MPLTAIVKDTESVLFSLNLTPQQLRDYPKGSLLCPECATIMFPRFRAGYINHFVHTVSDKPCSIKGNNESIEHLMLKRDVWEQCQKAYPDCEVRIEYPLIQDKKVVRVADVMVLFPSGYGLAFEIQLSKIPLKDFQDRTYSYHEHGYDVQWIVPESTTNEVKQWLLDNAMLNTYQERRSKHQLPFENGLI